MSHGRTSNGFIIIMANAELSFECAREGLACPRCGQSDDFEIDINGTATIDNDGEVDFNLTPALGDDTTIDCANCGNTFTLGQATGNTDTVSCSFCHNRSLKENTVFTVIGERVCSKCNDTFEHSFFGAGLSD